ncbi:nuclease SbcCD subunit C-like [Corythoichthys intestinalis]|uniref:nuclease SbcCD subunit C-like n=1 Tax=Corythoichthys intestinalis TaxID=161448 RepID=UPI0025A65A28|nr:nuclease SbcCD subunit C-like [Corythoichthys intestinalis]
MPTTGPAAGTVDESSVPVANPAASSTTSNSNDSSGREESPPTSSSPLGTPDENDPPSPIVTETSPTPSTVTETSPTPSTVTETSPTPSTVTETSPTPSTVTETSPTPSTVTETSLTTSRPTSSVSTGTQDDRPDPTPSTVTETSPTPSTVTENPIEPAIQISAETAVVTSSTAASAAASLANVAASAAVALTGNSSETEEARRRAADAALNAATAARDFAQGRISAADVVAAADEAADAAENSTAFATEALEGSSGDIQFAQLLAELAENASALARLSANVAALAENVSASGVIVENATDVIARARMANQEVERLGQQLQELLDSQTLPPGVEDNVRRAIEVANRTAALALETANVAQDTLDAADRVAASTEDEALLFAELAMRRAVDAAQSATQVAQTAAGEPSQASRQALLVAAAVSLTVAAAEATGVDLGNRTTITLQRAAEAIKAALAVTEDDADPQTARDAMQRAADAAEEVSAVLAGAVNASTMGQIEEQAADVSARAAAAASQAVTADSDDFPNIAEQLSMVAEEAEELFSGQPSMMPTAEQVEAFQRAQEVGRLLRITGSLAAVVDDDNLRILLDVANDTVSAAMGMMTNPSMEEVEASQRASLAATALTLSIAAAQTTGEDLGNLTIAMQKAANATAAALAVVNGPQDRQAAIAAANIAAECAAATAEELAAELADAVNESSAGRVPEGVLNVSARAAVAARTATTGDPDAAAEQLTEVARFAQDVFANPPDMQTSDELEAFEQAENVAEQAELAAILASAVNDEEDARTLADLANDTLNAAMGIIVIDPLEEVEASQRASLAAAALSLSIAAAQTTGEDLGNLTIAMQKAANATAAALAVVNGPQDRQAAIDAANMAAECAATTAEELAAELSDAVNESATGRVPEDVLNVSARAAVAARTATMGDPDAAAEQLTELARFAQDVFANPPDMPTSDELEAFEQAEDVAQQAEVTAILASAVNDEEDAQTLADLANATLNAAIGMMNAPSDEVEASQRASLAATALSLTIAAANTSGEDLGNRSTIAMQKAEEATAAALAVVNEPEDRQAAIDAAIMAAECAATTAEDLTQALENAVSQSATGRGPQDFVDVSAQAANAAREAATGNLDTAAEQLAMVARSAQDLFANRSGVLTLDQLEALQQAEEVANQAEIAAILASTVNDEDGARRLTDRAESTVNATRELIESTRMSVVDSVRNSLTASLTSTTAALTATCSVLAASAGAGTSAEMALNSAQVAAEAGSSLTNMSRNSTSEAAAAAIAAANACMVAAEAAALNASQNGSATAMQLAEFAREVAAIATRAGEAARNISGDNATTETVMSVSEVATNINTDSMALFTRLEAIASNTSQELADIVDQQAILTVTAPTLATTMATAQVADLANDAMSQTSSDTTALETQASTAASNALRAVNAARSAFTIITGTSAANVCSLALTAALGAAALWWLL